LRFKVIYKLPADSGAKVGNKDVGEHIELEDMELALRLMNDQLIAPTGRVVLRIYSELLDSELLIVAEGQEITELLKEQITDVFDYSYRIPAIDD
jgi:hypothetical protein